MPKFSIHPPTAGISRTAGFQSQPPYTCTASTNFWPIDTRDGRHLTATRPAQATVAFAPSNYPINMFAQLNIPSPTAFCAANGKLYKRSSAGVWSDAAPATAVGVSTGRPVFASPFFRQLLIANTNIPLHYDNDTGLMVELVPTAGFVPTGCRLTMTFQGSVWIGGSLSDPLGAHVFSAHRFSDLHDWDFAADDELGAYISTGEDRGLITEPLTAMIALTADQSILGCEEEIWVMSGHPRRGGRFDRISNQTGILGQGAWCNTPKGFFFLSHDGMMGMARNDYANLTVVPVSKAKVPDSLLDIEFDAAQPTVCMSYCSRWNAIYLTVRSTTRPQSWMYFLETGGFYEQPLIENPLVMFPFESLVTDDASGVLFGGGALKRFDRTASEEITASQIIGPVKLSSSPLEANQIQNASVLFAPGTTDDNAIVSIYTGPTGASAVARAEADSATYRYQTTVGRIRKNNRAMWPQLRGHAATLKITQADSTQRIVFEDFVGNLTPAGDNFDGGLVAPTLTPPIIPDIQIEDN